MSYRVLCLAPTGAGRGVCLFSALAQTDVAAARAIRAVRDHQTAVHHLPACAAVTVVTHSEDESCDHESEEATHA